MAKVKIEGSGTNNYRFYVDDVEIPYVKGCAIKMSPEERPVVTIEIVATSLEFNSEDSEIVYPGQFVCETLE